MRQGEKLVLGRALTTLLTVGEKHTYGSASKTTSTNFEISISTIGVI